MKHIIPILLLLCSSCVTSQKVTRYLEEHPEEFAQLCADEFPVEESEATPGKPQVQEKEETAPGPVVPCQDEKGEQLESAQCPPVVTKYVYTTRTDTMRVRDRAAERVLQDRAKMLEQQLSTVYTTSAEKQAKLEQENEEAQGKATRRGWIIAGIIGAAGLYTLWRFRRLLGVPV